MKPEDDVISLVDVATIFVRRWVSAVAVFLIVVAAGIGYAFTLKDTHSVTYITTVQPAVIPEKQENVATLLTLMETKWMSAAEEQYRERSGQALVPIKVRQVPGTRMIELLSSGTKFEKQAVVESHRTLAQMLVEEQNLSLNRWVGLLEQQLEDFLKFIQEGQKKPHPADVRLKNKLQQDIQSGEAAEILMLASEKRTVKRAPSLKLVVVLSALIGLLLGCLTPFVVEFVCQVRNRLSELRTD